ncbi:MAG: ABC transporter [Leptolyngbyaceae cyanobacterium RU_5_1]|nr:ABC transporter [Leptolyngbyaceae cyanobacterium RU_5_1]
MTVRKHSNFSEQSADETNRGESVTLIEEHRRTQTRIRLRIPRTYYKEPVISRLISQHELTVNIAAALLGPNARDDGWFDLELEGTGEQIRSALLYLNELDLEIWQDDANAEDDGW